MMRSMEFIIPMIRIIPMTIGGPTHQTAATTFRTFSTVTG